MKNRFTRGNVFYADLSPVVGSEQGGTRPVVLLQNDIGNRYSSTLIVAAISSNIDKVEFPTHILLRDTGIGLARDSIVLLEQIRTIDRQRLRNHIGMLDGETMREIDAGLVVSFGLSFDDES
jgi:Growth inhibitor